VQARFVLAGERFSFDDAMDATCYTLHTALGRAHPAQTAWDAWLLMRAQARERDRKRSNSA